MRLTHDTLPTAFQDFQQSAFRLEVHQVYTMPAEEKNRQRFLAGEPKPDDHNAKWHETIRANVAAGKTMQRAKIVRRPFTDYTRYLMSWGVPGNVAAGEQYRIIDVTDREVDLPTQDFWLFDDSAILLLNFNDDGTLRDREIAESPDISKYRRWRDIAIEESVPFLEYRA